MTVIRDASHIRQGLEALAVLDPRLLPVIEAAGPVPLRLQEPGFAGLASIVVSQMVSKASASAIWGRIAARGPVTAAGYLALEPAVVAGFGLSRAKASTLLSLSNAIEEGRLDLSAVCELETQDAIATLTRLPGIGPWTAEVYLLFAAGHPDIFPSGDVALRTAAGEAFGLTERPADKSLRLMSLDWRPQRSIAARLLWAYYARRHKRDAMPVL